MRVTILYSGLSTPSVGWLAIDEFAELLAYYFDAELLSPLVQEGTKIWNFGYSKKKFSTVESTGGDLLIVVARSPADLGMVNSIKHSRTKFDRIIGFVADSYFEAGYGKFTALYDSIAVTAKDDVAYVKDKYGIVVHHVYQGIDAIKWAPKYSRMRDIELISYGRTPPTYHSEFMKKFHDVASDILYLHSPLGNLSGPTVRDERGMLFKILQRTRISLAFHMYVEATGNRPVSMMVTSRWLESLISGCIVAGRRPISIMADEMLCWDGSTIELSERADEAVDQLIDILANNDRCEQQRRSNIYNMMTRHDWRMRVKEICSLSGLEIPNKVDDDLHFLSKRAEMWL